MIEDNLEASVPPPGESRTSDVDIAHEAASIADARFERTERGRGLLSDPEIGTDVLDLAEETVELRNKATVDERTGLLNEVGLKVAVDRLAGLVVAEGDSIFVVKIDMRYFKIFNDLFGQEAGDECLEELGKLLRGVGGEPAFRDSDVLGREGGDEFVGAFWIKKGDRSGNETILDTVNTEGNIVDRLKNIGDTLQQSMYEQYGEEYANLAENDPKLVRNALRLTDDHTIPRDWRDAGIASLTIGGLGVNSEILEQLWEEYSAKMADRQDEQSKMSFWKNMLSPRVKEQFDEAKKSRELGSRFVGREI